MLKQQMLTASSEELQLRLAHSYLELGQAAAPEQDESCLGQALLLYQAVLAHAPHNNDAKQVGFLCVLCTVACPLLAIKTLTLMQKSLSSLRAVTEAVARAAVLLVVWVRSTEWVPHKRHALSGSAATCCH